MNVSEPLEFTSCTHDALTAAEKGGNRGGGGMSIEEVEESVKAVFSLPLASPCLLALLFRRALPPPSPLPYLPVDLAPLP